MNYFNSAKPNDFLPLFIDFEDYNFGLAFGIGTLIAITETMVVTLELRNDLGLSDINKFPNQTSGEIKTNTVRLIATYNFSL